ncbi:MAG: polyribonucleotide nucleotidyltransferase [Candidatus Nealsonbacteria bacterium]|nr:polyribonucleotide nucleotidyltransferase [Candidatus Nealsonbacteria bacterium]
MENFKLKIGAKDFEVKIKNLASQAAGDILVQYGETMVLATAVMSDLEREGIDFFPLTVEYEERFYAAGKILGSRYIRRESRPPDEAILTARLIDRAIRPRFPQNLKKETQVIVTCLSWDKENDPDILGLISSSLALSISDIPWSGPIACLRIIKIGENFILNPTYEEREKSSFDLVLAGVEEENSDQILVNMIEFEGNEVQEQTILEAIEFAKPFLKEIINFQKEIQKKIGKEKILLAQPLPDLKLEQKIKEFLGDKLEKIIFQKEKLKRRKGLDNLLEELLNFIKEDYSGQEKQISIKELFKKEINRIVSLNIIELEKRPDGRKLDEIRNLQIEIGILPRTHGSGLFIRGDTKSLSILTLGTPGDVKLLEGMEVVGKKRFMHHYNFPPYSTGEIKPMRGPGRRDVGHGMLVEKSLLPLIPVFDEFPYTMRIVSEILSSNGSTSMAAVSSSSLALMEAGVPIKKHVAGISIGLMTDNKGNYKILTDIQGPEDQSGDMDFKIAGTEEGITAIQLDVKIDGINQEILKKALEQGKRARVLILNEMAKVISKPKNQLSLYAPRILTLQINPEKIREVIGPGGRIINEIIEKCQVSINVENTGKIFVTAEKEEAAKKAIEWIKNITREVKVGEIFQGKVKRILDFGAFVEIFPGQEGMVHISQLAPFRVERVEDIVKINQMIPVKVISIDEQGRINLSLKEAQVQAEKKGF